MLRADFVNNLVYGRIPGVTLNLDPIIRLSTDADGTLDSGALLNSLDAALMGGRMQADMLQVIRKAVDAAPTAQAKVQAAIYLIASSWQYQVER